MKLTHTETQTPHTHSRLHARARALALTHTHTHVFTGFRARTHTHIHTRTPTPTHTPRRIARICAGVHFMSPPTRLTLKWKKIKIITTTASQVPKLLCQSTDWINWKFYEVCGHLKWFSPVKSQYALSQCQHVPPYIRFEGIVELCSRLWLVVAVRQRDKRKGSIVHEAIVERKNWTEQAYWWTDICGHAEQWKHWWVDLSG